MPKRETVDKPNIYFGCKSELQFVSTGCTVLDCALGGGLCLGRVVNIVGDKSTSKTALATEAIINFLHQFPKGKARYRETEAAFDTNYAASMGLPLDKVDFGAVENPLITVEDFSRDLDEFIEEQTKAKEPGIYVLDSLDALSDEAEMERDISEGTYGTKKASKLSVLFRTTARKLETTQILLIIVSQIRENIGVTFGEKYKRSGGKALDFYASQVVWLAHLKILKRTIGKVERPYGVEIRAKIKKNKVGLAFRECEFEFHFAFGVEDLLASIEWLKSVGRLEELGDLTPEKARKGLTTWSNEDYRDWLLLAQTAVKKVWQEIDTQFLPQRRKYTE